MEFDSLVGSVLQLSFDFALPETIALENCQLKKLPIGLQLSVSPAEMFQLSLECMDPTLWTSWIPCW